jgi:hypothetical protein
MKRIFRWSTDKELLELITDIHYKPLSLACDTQDNLLVVAEYLPPKGATINGEPEVYTNDADAEGTSYSFWYKKGAAVKIYAIDPDHPDSSFRVLEKVPMDKIGNIYKALYPANRWRDSSDYLSVAVNRPESCFVAPDGITVIPVCYDLMRAVCLIEAFPGKTVLAVDEYSKRTVRFDVSKEGYMYNPVTFAEQGETNLAVAKNGDVYIPDGHINIYGPDGRLKGEFELPERPSCVIFGDSEGKTLYVTARSSLYRQNC